MFKSKLYALSPIFVMLSLFLSSPFSPHPSSHRRSDSLLLAYTALAKLDSGYASASLECSNTLLSDLGRVRPALGRVFFGSVSEKASRPIGSQ